MTRCDLKLVIAATAILAVMLLSAQHAVPPTIPNQTHRDTSTGAVHAGNGDPPATPAQVPTLKRKPDRKMFDRIVIGMTYDRVIEALGVPPGNYATQGVLLSARGKGYQHYKRWITDEGELLILFKNGTVADVRIWDVIVTKPADIDP